MISSLKKCLGQCFDKKVQESSAKTTFREVIQPKEVIKIENQKLINFDSGKTKISNENLPNEQGVLIQIEHKRISNFSIKLNSSNMGNKNSETKYSCDCCKNVFNEILTTLCCHAKICLICTKNYTIQENREKFKCHNCLIESDSPIQLIYFEEEKIQGICKIEKNNLNYEVKTTHTVLNDKSQMLNKNKNEASLKQLKECLNKVVNLKDMKVNQNLFEYNRLCRSFDNGLYYEINDQNKCSLNFRKNTFEDNIYFAETYKGSLFESNSSVQPQIDDIFEEEQFEI